MNLLCVELDYPPSDVQFNPFFFHFPGWEKIKKKQIHANISEPNLAEKKNKLLFFF